MRFIWIDNKEDYDKAFGSYQERKGGKVWVEPDARWCDAIEPILYDTEAKEIVMDFGDSEKYYPSAGTAPNDKYKKIIIDALNNGDMQ